jgi:hypothetical protein
MFDNVVLDVFIGLVLIYLLYGLLVTVLSEIVVSWLGLRSRVLRVSLEKMLNDGYFGDDNTQQYKGVWFIVQRFFLKEFPAFKHSFAGVFYSYPSVKYLAQRAGEQKTAFTETKPSYISDDNFADTLIQMLKDKGSGATEMDKILFCLQFNTYQVQPATLKRLRDLAENAGKDLSIFKNNLKSWYNETQDRTSGWFKRKLQLILFWLGFIVAIIFNVDSLRIAKILSKDENAREQLVKMGIELSKDSARYKEFLQNNDTELPQAVLDSGYNRITKDISEANMVLGLSWGTDKLFKDLECPVKPGHTTAHKIVAEEKDDFELWLKDIREQRAAILLDIDSLDKAMVALKKSIIDSLRAGDTLLSEAIPANRKSITLYKTKISRDSLIIVQNMDDLKQFTEKLNKSLESEFTSIDSIKIKGDGYIAYGKRHYYWYEKLWYVLKNTFTGYRFIGFFITGLMLSLGAPFWFDLLKKLVSMRGDGVKPEEKRNKNTEIKISEESQRVPGMPPIIVPASIIPGNIESEAITLNGPMIKKIPGVISVFSVFNKAANQRNVQINVDSSLAAAEVNSQFPVLKVGNLSVKPVVIVSGTPVTHAGNVGIISNKSGMNGAGSLGCVLEKKTNGIRHILSCWHVLKGDTNYSDPDDLKLILDHANADCASRWAGGIKNQFDYGIARCIVPNDFNNFLRTKLGIGINTEIQFREITREDVDNQIAVRYYDSLNGVEKKGIIYSDCDEAPINYLDQRRKILDLLLLQDGNGKPFSDRGNSGSIIFDDSNFAIGMIISGDSKYTYAIKLSHVFRLHKEMIIV